VKRSFAYALEALLSGDYGHEVRGDIEIKNLLSTGAVTAAAVVDIIKRSRVVHQVLLFGAADDVYQCSSVI